ncbi:MAG: branched-chain amino acid ABC transporter permease [Thermodesulfovibrionales bacterium]|nr:branched-chain amino acid ABC transporter permease [Thermodesulfovibrionales bacterium]
MNNYIQSNTHLIRLFNVLLISILVLPFIGLQHSATLLVVLLVVFFLKDYLKVFFSSLALSFSGYSFSRYKKAILVVSSVIILIIPIMPYSQYATDVITLCLIYVILACGLNVIVGMTGLLHLGYAAFYAIGAYSYALLSINTGIPFLATAVLSIVITSFIGLMTAFPALRLKGDYLAIVTLGFGEILRVILNNWQSLTNGPNGLSGIPAPHVFVDFTDARMMFYLTAVVCFVSVFIILRVERSKIGRAWRCIKEDETVALAMGIDVVRYKLISFVFGSFWAGLAGVLYASKMGFVSPDSFTFLESILILCMVIVGGLGNTYGAIIGAFILICIPEILRDIQTFRMLIVGLVLVLLVIFLPKGIVGSIKDVNHTNSKS